MNSFQIKKLLVIFFILPLVSFSQDYVDILKVGYSTAFNSTFENTSHSTDVKSFDIGLTYPIVLNEKSALITGADFILNNLQLAPNTDNVDLYSTTLKIGLTTTFNEKWKGTLVLLPKIASDYNSISNDDFYIGSFGSLKYKKSEHLSYKFGFYFSTEAFGVFATPVFGLYYKSPNERLEIDASLPITADINYSLGKTTIGFDYFGIGRSYLIHQNNTSPVYVEQSPLEFASYIQFNTFNKNILVRAKLGYTTNKHEVYAENDKLDFRLSAFSFGDDRTQLNPTLNGSIFLKVEAVYRFHIKKKEANN